MSNALNIGFDFVIITEQDGKVVFVNENIQNVLGYTRSDLIENSILDAIYTDDKKEIEKLLKDIKIQNVYRTIRLRAKSNDIKKMLIHVTKVDIDKIYFIITGKDVTYDLKLQKSIEDILKHDTTTNLLNRYSFIEAVEEYIERVEYQKTIGAVVILKPLGFSEINEALGFEKGNKLLIEIAKRLKTFVKRFDLTSRLDSAKFAVFLKNIKREEDIFVAVVNLMKELSKPYLIDKEKLELSFNAGISIYPYDSKDANSLVEKAEIALIDARNKGENAIGLYKEELKQETAKRVKINQEFPEALKNRKFILHFQPYFDIETKKPKGAEVLVRWIKNDIIVPPSEFIPVIEQNHNIIKLEEYILNKVVEFIEHFDNKDNLIPLSINLSPTSLSDSDFVNNLISKAKGIAKFINIEITERLFLDNIRDANLILNKIRDSGFKVYMDDFGTGYSSLSYLSFLPIDCVKIDMSFVRALMENKKVNSIVKTIIYLAEELNLSTIAEGVETEEQLLTLKNMKCQMVQGFLLSRPLEIKRFLDFLDKQSR